MSHVEAHSTAPWPGQPGLPGLPGSSTDPGTGPLAEPLLEYLMDDAGLLDDAGLMDDAGLQNPDALRDDAAPGAAHRHRPSVAEVLEGHRDRLRSDLAHLLGPLVVPAELAEPFAEALTAGDDAMRVLLVAPDGTPAGRHRLRTARDLLAEDERVAIVGVRIGVPPGPPALTTAALLTMLDFTVPAWIEVPPGPDATEVLRGVATDGAEEITLMATPGTDDRPLSALIRTVLDDDQPFRVVVGPRTELVRTDDRHGLLNLLAAVRSGWDGAGQDDIEQILACRDLAPLTSGLRQLSETDAAVTRAYLASIEVTDVASTQARLLALGLLSLPE